LAFAMLGYVQLETMATIFPVFFRIRALSWCALAALCLFLWACDRPFAHSERPNIVLVSVDTLNQDALRAFAPQAPELPSFDRLASESTRFSHAYTPSSWTLPAHTSVFTGRYPNRHGVVRIEQALPVELPLLQSILKNAGYQTVAFTDGALLDPAFGHSRGFQFYDNQKTDAPFTLRGDIPRRGAPHPDPSSQIFDRAIAYLDQRHSDDPPFFLFTHTFAVHHYFRFNPHDMKPLEGAPNDLGCLLGETKCSPQHWSDLKALYSHRVTQVDKALGQLLLAIERHAPNTVVILFSDHGEGFDGPRARIHHAGRLHEDLLNVPLLIRLPEGVGREEEVPVSLVDLMPTILDLADAPIPPDLDGLSLRGALMSNSEKTLPNRSIFALEYSYSWEDGKRTYRPAPSPLGVAVINDRGWYIASPEREELYARSGDPEQRVNLAEQPGSLESFRELSDEAATWAAPPSAAVPIEGELESHLRAIGYIE